MNEISNKVMKMDDYIDSSSYRIACDCTNGDCDCSITIETDEEIPFYINILFYKKLIWSCHYGGTNWFQRVWKRLKGVFILLFKGWIEVEEALLLRDPEHIENFINAIREGQAKIINLWEKEKDKNLN